MKVYLDTSVVLRHVLKHGTPWRGWGIWDMAFSSFLLHIECLRVADRLRLTNALDDKQRVLVGTAIEMICESLVVLPPHEAILRRAAGSFPTIIGTLDAMHVASALLLREQRESDLMMVTCDRQQARAAAAVGLAVTLVD